MPVTLKELAELSGCSIRTVSRVLRGNGPVSLQKKEEIESLVRKFHYVPNMAARNLKTDHRSCVGVISSGIYSSSIFSRKMSDLTSRLEKLNYYPLQGLYTSSGGMLTRTFREWEGIVSSVIFFAPLQKDIPEITLLAEHAGLRIAAVDCDDGFPEFASRLQIDRSVGIVEAIDALADSGHTRILRFGDIATRDSGWAAAMEKYPAMNFSHMRFVAEADAAAECFDKILESGADAVFFDTDRAAAGFLRQAIIHKVNIPERISVVGFDDESFCPLLQPALSTVAHPVELLNEAAVEFISGNGKASDKKFPSFFIRRESIADRKN